MTINLADNSPRISYAVAQGVTQTSFAVPFEFFADADLNVYVDGTLKTLTTHYTVSGGDGSTGTVTISVTGATGGSTVVITRDVALERTSDFPSSGPFQIGALNTELDRLTAIAADLDDKAGRALQLTDFDAAVSLTLPEVDTRKGKTLAFNASTGAVESGPSISDVQTVSAAAADIATLADIEDGTDATDAIQTVAGISSNVTTVAGISANVTTVAGISANVTAVAGDASDIGTVATNIANVNTAATNITEIQNASANAATATTKASEAATSASNASTSETNAATSAATATTKASEASTSATNAATSETNAGNSATAAAASAAAAAAAFDNFDDTYLGSKTSDPTVDNDGNALVSGALYFNSTANEMRVYDGANWIAASSAGTASLILYEYTATSGQTTFSGADDNSASLSYSVGNIQVVMNGIVLDPSDFTATSGTSVVLASGAATDDLVNIYAFKSFTVADTVSASAGGTFAGNVNFTGAFTSQGIDDNATSTAMTLDASGNVGIGVVPETWNSANNGLQVGPRAAIFGTDSGYSGFSNNHYQATDGSAKYIVTAPAAIINLDPDSTIKFRQAASGTADTNITWAEAMRIDSSGNLLVGKTTNSSSVDGVTAFGVGAIEVVRSSSTLLYLNRKTSDGDIATFRKDGSTVGSIGVNGGRLFINGDNGSSGGGLKFTATDARPVDRNGSDWDNNFDMGDGGVRFDDIYATNGTIQTSDRNEKQDIAELSDAEQRVAIAAKGLMRKFRWRDAVEAKGDNARTHFGIIAQDLQAAFVAEGLDAGDYAMFISTTWWETQTEVPSVEAVAEVLDEGGNVVTEAVEAADAYTRTDTYDTQEEAPEGATERTRLGVRYSELLAFIIGAL
jgi:hypothetical protein